MPALSFPMVFGLIMAAADFMVVMGIAQARRSAGGAEDFQALLAAYGVTTAGATALETTAGFRDTLNHLFQPAVVRFGRGDTEKGKPSVAEQLQRADLKLRTSEYFMIQVGCAAVLGLLVFFRFHLGAGPIT